MANYNLLLNTNIIDIQFFFVYKVDYKQILLKIKKVMLIL